MWEVETRKLISKSCPVTQWLNDIRLKIIINVRTIIKLPPLTGHE